VRRESKTVAQSRSGERGLSLRQGFLGVLLTFVAGTACAGATRSGASGSCVEEVPLGRHSVDELSALARVIQAGMRTAMLAGDGLTVRDFLQNLQESSTGVDVSLYASSGEEVYAPKGPAPDFTTLPAHVQKVLTHPKPASTAKGGVAFPLKNEKDCQSCHKNGDLRAVLTLEFNQGSEGTRDADLVAMGKITEATFDAMMTLGKASATDEFLQELPKLVPGVATAAVFSMDGRASLGDGFMEVPAEIGKRALSPTEPFAADTPEGRIAAIPLPNGPRCRNCHKESEMRGALILRFDDKFNREESARELVSASLKRVMMTGMGRLTKRFLDDTARSGLIEGLTVHDAAGRVFHDINAKIVPPNFVAEALRTGEVHASDQPGGRARVVLPVSNDDKCRRCHDDDGPVRAVITVTSRSRRL